MQFIEHCIDSEVWDKLPKEAQDILRSHHYGPPIRIKGRGVIKSSTIVDVCVEKDTHIDDADSSIIYID